LGIGYRLISLFFLWLLRARLEWSDVMRFIWLFKSIDIIIKWMMNSYWIILNCWQRYFHFHCKYNMHTEPCSIPERFPLITTQRT
jgi:hypothetical protein